MTKCIDCKSSMIPKQTNLRLFAVCTNPNQTKGLIELSFKCKYGVKNETNRYANINKGK